MENLNSYFVLGPTKGFLHDLSDVRLQLLGFSNGKSVPVRYIRATAQAGFCTWTFLLLQLLRSFNWIWLASFLPLGSYRPSYWVKRTPVRNDSAAYLLMLVHRRDLPEKSNLCTILNSAVAQSSTMSMSNIIDKVAPQLKDYIKSKEVKKKLKDEGLLLKAHVVIVVGSRHVLVWDMDSDGKLTHAPDLVDTVALLPSVESQLRSR